MVSTGTECRPIVTSKDLSEIIREGDQISEWTPQNIDWRKHPKELLRVPTSKPEIKIVNDSHRHHELMLEAIKNDPKDSACDLHLICQDGYVPVHRIFLQEILKSHPEPNPGPNSTITELQNALKPAAETEPIVSVILAEMKVVHVQAVVSLIYGGEASILEEDEGEVRSVIDMLQMTPMWTSLVLEKVGQGKDDPVQCLRNTESAFDLGEGNHSEPEPILRDDDDPSTNSSAGLALAPRRLSYANAVAGNSQVQMDTQYQSPDSTLTREPDLSTNVQEVNKQVQAGGTPAPSPNVRNQGSAQKNRGRQRRSETPSKICTPIKVIADAIQVHVNDELPGPSSSSTPKRAKPPVHSHPAVEVVVETDHNEIHVIYLSSDDEEEATSRSQSHQEGFSNSPEVRVKEEPDPTITVDTNEVNATHVEDTESSNAGAKPVPTSRKRERESSGSDSHSKKKPPPPEPELKCMFCGQMYVTEAELQSHLHSACGSHLEFDLVNRICNSCSAIGKTYTAAAFMKHVSLCCAKKREKKEKQLAEKLKSDTAQVRHDTESSEIPPAVASTSTSTESRPLERMDTEEEIVTPPETQTLSNAAFANSDVHRSVSLSIVTDNLDADQISEIMDKVQRRQPGGCGLRWRRPKLDSGWKWLYNPSKKKAKRPTTNQSGTSGATHGVQKRVPTTANSTSVKKKASPLRIYPPQSSSSSDVTTQPQHPSTADIIASHAKLRQSMKRKIGYFEPGPWFDKLFGRANKVRNSSEPNGTATQPRTGNVDEERVQESISPAPGNTKQGTPAQDDKDDGNDEQANRQTSQDFHQTTTSGRPEPVAKNNTSTVEDIETNAIKLRESIKLKLRFSQSQSQWVNRTGIAANRRSKSESTASSTRSTSVGNVVQQSTTTDPEPPKKSQASDGDGGNSSGSTTDGMQVQNGGSEIIGDEIERSGGDGGGGGTDGAGLQMDVPSQTNQNDGESAGLRSTTESVSSGGSGAEDTVESNVAGRDGDGERETVTSTMEETSKASKRGGTGGSVVNLRDVKVEPGLASTNPTAAPVAANVPQPPQFPLDFPADVSLPGVKFEFERTADSPDTVIIRRSTDGAVDSPPPSEFDWDAVMNEEGGSLLPDEIDEATTPPIPSTPLSVSISTTVVPQESQQASPRLQQHVSPSGCPTLTSPQRLTLRQEEYAIPTRITAPSNSSSISSTSISPGLRQPSISIPLSRSPPFLPPIPPIRNHQSHPGPPPPHLSHQMQVPSVQQPTYRMVSRIQPPNLLDYNYNPRSNTPPPPYPPPNSGHGFSGLDMDRPNVSAPPPPYYNPPPNNFQRNSIPLINVRQELRRMISSYDAHQQQTYPPVPSGPPPAPRVAGPYSSQGSRFIPVPSQKHPPPPVPPTAFSTTLPPPPPPPQPSPSQMLQFLQHQGPTPVPPPQPLGQRGGDTLLIIQDGNQPSFTCPRCGRPFRSKESFDDHILLNHC